MGQFWIFWQKDSSGKHNVKKNYDLKKKSVLYKYV
jgi:hypothetical protein